MGIGNKQVIDEIFVFYFGGRAAAATAFLRLVDINRLRFGIATVRHRHHDFLFRNQIFDAQIGMVLHNLGAPFVAINVANIRQLCLDDIKQHIGICQNIRKFFNFS